MISLDAMRNVQLPRRKGSSRSIRWDIIETFGLVWRNLKITFGEDFSRSRSSISSNRDTDMSIMSHQPGLIATISSREEERTLLMRSDCSYMIDSGRLSCRIDDISTARSLNCLSRDNNMAKPRAVAKTSVLQLREYVVRKAMYICSISRCSLGRSCSWLSPEYRKAEGRRCSRM